jgi:phospholipid/cholesterol/gamma-HCH transport system ATP-binding protein
MPSILELKKLTVSRIVEDFNLQLEQGMTALFKLSGEQEVRTILQVLTGKLLPDSGSVLLDQTDLAGLDRNKLFKTRHSIGIITAQANLISNLKVWENITLPLLYHYGTIPSETADRAMQLLSELGLKNSLWSLPGHLSRAERIMVTFIRSVIVSPRLLIYAACLDDLPGQQREVFLQRVVQLQQQSNAPAALFMTVADLKLPAMQPDFLCDLRQNPVQVTRQS